MKKILLLSGIFCSIFILSKAQCPNPVVCSSGGNGDIVSLKLDGRGGIKTTASFTYDNGITLDAYGAMPNFTFKSMGTTRMTISSNGNVGIGCTSPTVKLAVNGKIQATEVEIKSAPCSDYVFEKAYKLMPLTEVEKFVNENKHLPEVPSAQEFAKNGYNIGEMDDLLLRKVEELTLYLIELKKENEKLQEQINSLIN